MTITRREALAAASDIELLRWAADKDDREAFDELVRRLAPSLLRMAYGKVHPSLTDDLVQEVLYRAWRYRRSYNGEAKPLTWLHVIMRHIAISPAFRLIPGAEAAGDLDLLDDLEGPDDLAAVLDSEAIDAMLGRLEPRHAEIIRRRHIDRQDWPVIVGEMSFPNLYFTKKAYRMATAKLARLLAN